MSKKYNASMFDKIKDTLQKSEKTSNGSFANIMKFPAGHTYTLRLIPDVEGLSEGEDKTFFHHYVHQWTSRKDGSFVSAISLRSFGERDPINEARWRLYKDWKDGEPAADEKFENPIKEKEQWFVNVYVVDDPSNPENNGKVKILSMGPQLKAIVDEAMTGDRADEFGPAIFDLSSDGADFKIKADKQGVYTTYIKSFFTSKSSLDLSDEEIDEIYGKTHDLTKIYQVKTAEELQDLLDQHFFCGEDVDGAPKKEVAKKVEPKKEVVKKTTPAKKPAAKPESVIEEDDIPMFHDTDSNVDDILDELDLD
jgi:hypothetical protein